MLRECATAGLVAPQTIADLQLIMTARDRGELRGMQYVRVVGPPRARRVVSADEPSSTPRLSAARSTAAYRGQRLAQLSRQIRLDQISRSLSRAARLTHLEQEIEKAKAARRGAATHFTVEMYTAGPYTGPLIKSNR